MYVLLIWVYACIIWASYITLYLRCIYLVLYKMCTGQDDICICCGNILIRDKPLHQVIQLPYKTYLVRNGSEKKQMFTP